MNPSRFACVLSTVFVASLFLASTGRAQSILITEYNGKMLPVVGAKSTRPYVLVDGKPVLAPGKKYSLGKIKEFTPVFVKVRNLKVNGSSAIERSSGSELNHEFHFQAYFESAFTLEDVFIVIDLDTENGGKHLFLYEIGRLEARQVRPLTLNANLTYRLGQGKFKLHLFSKGLELLHSQQPFEVRESMLDQLIARRVKNLPDGPPSLLVGPAPDRPGKRRKDTPPGKVVVKMRIRSTGAVLDPTVVEASDPALAEAALAAVRQWRFLPAMKAGHAVETTASVPIDFPGGEEPEPDPKA